MNLPSFDFTNWREHPSDNRYEVFFFKTKDESKFFENLLQQNSIPYESYTDEKEPTYKYFFATSKTNRKEVIRLNHITIGKFRSRFISNKVLRYSLLILTIIVLALGITGYLKTH